MASSQPWVELSGSKHWHGGPAIPKLCNVGLTPPKPRLSPEAETGSTQQNPQSKGEREGGQPVCPNTAAAVPAPSMGKNVTHPAGEQWYLKTWQYLQTPVITQMHNYFSLGVKANICPKTAGIRKHLTKSPVWSWLFPWGILRKMKSPLQ